MSNKLKRALSSILAFTMVLSMITVMNVSNVFAATTAYNLNTVSEVTSTIVFGSEKEPILASDSTAVPTLKTITEGTITSVAVNSSTSDGNTEDVTKFTNYVTINSNGKGFKVTADAGAVVGVYYAVSDSNGYASGKLKDGALEVDGTATVTSDTTYGKINYYESTVSANGYISYAVTSRRLNIFAITITTKTYNAGSVTITNNNESCGSYSLVNAEGTEVATDTELEGGTSLTLKLTPASGYYATVTINGDDESVNSSNEVAVLVNGNQAIVIDFKAYASRTEVTESVSIGSDDLSKSAVTANTGKVILDGVYPQSGTVYYFTYTGNASYATVDSSNVIRVGSSSERLEFSTGDLTGKKATIVVDFATGSANNERSVQIVDGSGNVITTKADSAGTALVSTDSAELSSNTTYTIKSTGSNIYIGGVTITVEEATEATDYFYAYFTESDVESAATFSIINTETNAVVADSEGNTEFDTVYSDVDLNGDGVGDNVEIPSVYKYVVAFIVTGADDNADIQNHFKVQLNTADTAE